VDVFGRGNGDVITTFRWTTPVTGAMPAKASGSAAVLADHDGELDSYGVELSVTNLDVRPARAAAVITVTGASGETTAITPRWHRPCPPRASSSSPLPARTGWRRGALRTADLDAGTPVVRRLTPAGSRGLRGWPGA
jgi:hypothetical protein